MEVTEPFELTSQTSLNIFKMVLLLSICLLGITILLSFVSIFTEGVEQGQSIAALAAICLFILLVFLLTKLLLDVTRIRALAEGLEIKGRMVSFNSVRSVKVYYSFYRIVVIKAEISNELIRGIGVLPVLNKGDYDRSISFIKRLRE